MHPLRIDPTSITGEITEAERIDDLAALIGFVRDSRAWGIKVAIDDFGCGYSTLALLQQIEVDIMKIDRHFIAALTGDYRSAAIVQSVIALAMAPDAFVSSFESWRN